MLGGFFSRKTHLSAHHKNTSKGVPSLHHPGRCQVLLVNKKTCLLPNKKTCFLFEQEDMSSCWTRRRVLLNRKTCLLAHMDTECEWVVLETNCLGSHGRVTFLLSPPRSARNLLEVTCSSWMPKIQVQPSKIHIWECIWPVYSHNSHISTG